MSKRSAFLLGTTIALMQVSILGCTKSATEVTKIAKEITVTIDGCSSGSGVIFHRQDNTYQVLTANHVIKTNQEFCRVITPDGVRHSPNTANIKPIEGVDLAVMQFDSSNSYRVGKFGNSSQVDIGTTVYVAGVPASTDEVPIRTLRVSPGQIIGISPQAPEGYTLIYNNTTRGGMSGGPVLDESGAIVGIHGKGNPSGGIKENYGIPIEKIKQVHEQIKQAQKISKCVGENDFPRPIDYVWYIVISFASFSAVFGLEEITGASWRENVKCSVCSLVFVLLVVFYEAVKLVSCETVRDTATVAYKWHSRE
ncbi:MAG: serine protease [Hormoscilla sp.]